MGGLILNPIIIFILVVAAIFLPISWILRVWSEQLVGTRLAVLGLIMHVLFLIILLSLSPLLLTIYCSIALLAIGLSTFLNLQAEWSFMKRRARTDIEKYRRMLGVHPDTAAIHAALGKAYWESNLYDEAIEELETAIRLDPHNSHAEENLLRRIRDRQQQKEEKQRK
jgi:tetratricopeptide (TPR) repeat protein